MCLCVRLIGRRLSPLLQRGGSGELRSLEEEVQLCVQNECQPPHWRPRSLRLQGVCQKGKTKKKKIIVSSSSLHQYTYFLTLKVIKKVQACSI